jgi:hypothetical protein
MDKTSNVFSQAFGLFKSKPKNISARTARASSARKMGATARARGPVKHYSYRSASVSAERSSCRCEAVEAISGHRFLLSDVPPIPLPNCTSPNCKCAYIRHNDRRSFSGDRRALFSLNTDLHAIGGKQELRQKKGRRRSDEPTFAASDADLEMAEWVR